MIINVVHFERVGSLEAKYDPPVAADIHGMKTGHLPFQGMKPQAGQRHVSNRRCRMKLAKNQPQASCMLGPNS